MPRRRRLLQQDQGSQSGEGCFQTLWDAVMNVSDATIWQQGLRNTGLDLILQDSSSNQGVLLVPKDDGVLGCNATVLADESKWPYGDCAQKAREWLETLGQPGGASLLMYHWLPNETFSSLERDDGESSSVSTLVEYASALPGLNASSSVGTSSFLSSRVSVRDGSSVSIPDGISSFEDRLGGFADASIVDKVSLCDGDLGGVYVIDQPLYPTGLPRLNSTSLPPLEGYCGESILGFLSRITKESAAPPYPSLFTATLAAQTAAAFPSLPPLLNPLTNVTALTPNFYDGSFNVIGYAGPTVNSTIIRDVLTAFSLTHYLPGAYCPSDFKDGLTVQTLAGVKAGKNYSLYIQQDKEDESVLNIDVLFGNNRSATQYTAQYLGQACYSSVYVLDSFMTPWNAPVAGNQEAQIPYIEISALPSIENQSRLIGLDSTCQSFLPEYSVAADAQSSSSLSGGAIAGIVIGSLCFIIALLAVVWWFLRNRSRATAVDVVGVTSSGKMHDGSGSNRFSSDGTLTVNSQKLSEILDYDLPSVVNELILTEKEVSIDLDPVSGKPVVLGQGRFGKVLQGTLLGVEPIAIKCIRGETLHRGEHADSPAHMQEDSTTTSSKTLSRDVVRQTSSLGIMSNDQVLREIALLKSCHSQHIVSFMGAMFLPREVRLVTELLPAGDLWSALGRGSRDRSVSWYRGGIFIAMDVAAGLKYLHEKRRVIHLDLKSSNILLRECHKIDGVSTVPSGYEVTHRAKISDVGLSKMLPLSHEYIKDLESGGTWNWCAPEVILCSKCTPAADMFSFGIVLWEICTGEIPLRGRLRDVEVPSECPREVADLIHACLDGSEGRLPSDRPTASQAFAMLQRLIQQTNQDYSSLHR